MKVHERESEDSLSPKTIENEECIMYSTYGAEPQHSTAKPSKKKTPSTHTTKRTERKSCTNGIARQRAEEYAWALLLHSSHKTRPSVREIFLYIAITADCVCHTQTSHIRWAFSTSNIANTLTMAATTTTKTYNKNLYLRFFLYPASLSHRWLRRTREMK